MKTTSVFEGWKVEAKVRLIDGRRVERPWTFLCIPFLVLPQNVRGLTNLGSVWGLVRDMGEISYYAPENVGSVWSNGRRVISAYDPSGRVV